MGWGRGRSPKKGPQKMGQMPKKVGRCGIWKCLRLDPEKKGGWGGSCVAVGGKKMEWRERERCVRYGGQTTTDDYAVCVRNVYGRDSGVGSDVM